MTHLENKIDAEKRRLSVKNGGTSLHQISIKIPNFEISDAQEKPKNVWYRIYNWF